MLIESNTKDEFEYCFELLEKILEKEFKRFSLKPFNENCECGKSVHLSSRLCFNHNHYKFICFFVPLLRKPFNVGKNKPIRFDIELINHNCKDKKTGALTYRMFNDLKENPQYEHLNNIFNSLRKENRLRIIEFFEQTLIYIN